MTLLSIFTIALALSMDAAAVAVCNVMAAHREPWSRLMAMPVLFGFFQGFLPFLGYFAGQALAGIVGQYAGILMGLVLGAIGLHMVKEGLEADDSCPSQALSLRLLLVQAIATSIDALAVGVSFGAAGVPLASILLIGLVTFAVVTLSLFLGRAFGTALGGKAQVLGGLLLCGIALYALFF